MHQVIAALLLALLAADFARADLKHRYSFNDGTARDSVGEADGVPINKPAIRDGQLIFDPAVNDGRNTDPNKGQYVKLPDGLLAHRAWTIELWTTYRGGRPWQRIVDFGNSVTATEPEKLRNRFDDKDAERGRGFLAIMHNRQGYLAGQISLASWGAHSDTDYAAAHQGLTLHREYHVVFTHDPELREQKLYVDGELVAAGLARVDARDTLWNNCYIGRSQFTWDPFYNGRVNELRIYDHALSREEVQSSAEAGPDELPSVLDPPESSADES